MICLDLLEDVRDVGDDVPLGRLHDMREARFESPKS
ncbi:hypothetical protein OROMI_014836 [Orobanche minor]